MIYITFEIKQKVKLLIYNINQLVLTNIFKNY